MKFSITTPSFRNSDWLKLCIASVADQEGVELEHIVQDAGSDDGTLDWLLRDSRVQAHVEKDEGMYDAINRGWRRASGDILAYLNCDEQYLPGALQAVHDFFATHPETDVVLADTVIVNPQGEYLCHRYSLIPRRHQLWVRFAVLTCAVFFRRRVLDEWQLYFDTRWRALGDAIWFGALVERGAKFAELRRFTSAFTETGDNLALKPVALEERQRRNRMAPWWVRLARPGFILAHRYQLLASGAFRQQPFEFALFTPDDSMRRTSRLASVPCARWIRQK
jgi:glycosyltransferase involved in cell wall biosynthesis